MRRRPLELGFTTKHLKRQLQHLNFRLDRYNQVKRSKPDYRVRTTILPPEPYHRRSVFMKKRRERIIGILKSRYRDKNEKHSTNIPSQ